MFIKVKLIHIWSVRCCLSDSTKQWSSLTSSHKRERACACASPGLSISASLAISDVVCQMLSCWSIPKRWYFFLARDLAEIRVSFELAPDHMPITDAIFHIFDFYIFYAIVYVAILLYAYLICLKDRTVICFVVWSLLLRSCVYLYWLVVYVPFLSFSCEVDGLASIFLLILLCLLANRYSCRSYPFSFFYYSFEAVLFVMISSVQDILLIL